MRKALKLYIILFFFVLPPTAIAQNNFDLIPKPALLRMDNGLFRFKAHTSVQVSPEFRASANLLMEHPAIKEITIQKINAKDPADILIKKATKADQLSPKAYSLQIRAKGIVIKAWDAPQVIEAIQTLLQLGYLQDDPERLAAAQIIDQPRFSYRGLHLDVSRHFMPLSFLKKYIDLMALYKFNQFHWHLTDGAGWRLQIKRYPELTEKAAWRTHVHWKDWWTHGRKYTDRGAPNAGGGFYTQEEAKELVAYALQRGINIIPEIEMPAHSEEVLAVYPQLSCTGLPYTQSEFCIGNEQTFVFLKNVLDEVLTIFPSKYIHMGGDEADKRHWKTCPKDQALMRREGLKTVDELQSYAIRQMDIYLQSKGRKLIGWDEILQGGLTEGATVMSWRGEEGGIRAANAGHDVIMTPGSYLYFDSYQTDPRTQPEAIGGYITLEKVYSYNPVPAAIASDKVQHILGAQANLWTEYIPTTEHAEYMAFPRALALSEVNWTPPQFKSWEDFHHRLQSHYRLLQNLNVNYFRPSYNVAYRAVYNAADKTSRVTLTTEQNDPRNIRYTVDGSEPVLSSKVYEGPFELGKSAKIKAAFFWDESPIGPVLEFDVDIHKAIGKPVQYISQWDGYAAQKEQTLTNGITGGLTYHDGQWQGFTEPIDLVVDMEATQPIHTIAMNFMQTIGPGVYMPGEMEVLLSGDGRRYQPVGKVMNDVSPKEARLTFKRFELSLDQPVNARYIRVKASNPGKGYLFTDEIMVY